MKRKYTTSTNVGRPIKYTTFDLKSIINKTKTDTIFAKMFNVSRGTICAIRSNQSKLLEIPIKDKWKNEYYGGHKNGNRI